MNEGIEKYRHDWEIISKTAAQLQKDFSSFGITIHFSGRKETAYDELMQQLIPVVEELITSQKQKFVSLLYRIDLSEKKVQHALEETGSSSAAARLAHLILERELLKVLTRKYFSDR